MDEDFSPVPQIEKHGKFLEKVVELMFKNVVFTTRQDKVLLWQTPEQLEEQFDFSLKQNGENHDKLINLLRNTIKFSVKTGHPYFINQLFSGLDPYGLAAQWLTDSLNASAYTYEVAPVFTLMEKQIIKEVCRMIGPKWGDGLFCPGGSFANGLAVNLARYKRYPEIKETANQVDNSFSVHRHLTTGRYPGGIKQERDIHPEKKGVFHLPHSIIFASEECHYSVFKFAAFLGIGEDNVCRILTDDIGRILPNDLEVKIRKTLEEGNVPILTIATLGTTVRGAFDPINEIADICTKYGMWLHIDAAWGGGLIFSQKHRAKLNGIERADSLVINPHKLLAVPQQCSLLLVKDTHILYDCFSREAEYLFQKDKHYDRTYDLGDKYLQCGRKCDVFKFWFMWKAKGSSGFASHIDALMDVAEYFEQQVNHRSEFLLVSERQYMNVCFWYIPKYLRGKSNIPENLTHLQKVAPQIRALMIQHGSVMLGYQPLKQLPNFFRFVSQNSALNKTDVDFILDHIQEIGDAIFK